MATKKKTATPKKKTAPKTPAKAPVKSGKGSGKAVLGAPPPRLADAVTDLAKEIKSMSDSTKIAPTALMGHLYDAVLLSYARGRTISAASREFGISSQAFGSALRLRAIKNPAFRSLNPTQI